MCMLSGCNGEKTETEGKSSGSLLASVAGMIETRSKAVRQKIFPPTKNGGEEKTQ